MATVKSKRLGEKICVAVHRATAHRPHPWWVAQGTIMVALGHDDPDAFDHGVLYCLERNWLQISSVPVHSLCVTWEGAMFAQRHEEERVRECSQRRPSRSVSSSTSARSSSLRSKKKSEIRSLT